MLWRAVSRIPLWSEECSLLQKGFMERGRWEMMGWDDPSILTCFNHVKPHWLGPNALTPFFFLSTSLEVVSFPWVENIGFILSLAYCLSLCAGIKWPLLFVNLYLFFKQLLGFQGLCIMDYETEQHGKKLFILEWYCHIAPETIPFHVFKKYAHHTYNCKGHKQHRQLLL